MDLVEAKRIILLCKKHELTKLVKYINSCFQFTTTLTPMISPIEVENIIDAVKMEFTVVCGKAERMISEIEQDFPGIKIEIKEVKVVNEPMTKIYNFIDAHRAVERENLIENIGKDKFLYPEYLMKGFKFYCDKFENINDVFKLKE